jgi:protein O-mannosyl-transferase
MEQLVPSSTQTASSWRWDKWGALAIIAVTWLAYLPALRGGFIWDDGLLITENRLVTSLSGLRGIWLSSAATDYTPLTLTAFWMEWRMWADNPMGYHIVNLVLHISSALLLWRVLYKMAVPGAWLGAMLFAVHPVNVASVAWIAEQKNTLSLFFLLLSIDRFIAFRACGTPVQYILSLAAAACAYLSKGSTVILPFILIGCIWGREQRIRFKDIITTLPFLALAAAMAFVTIEFQRRYVGAATVHESIGFRLIRAGYAIWFYIGKDIWPFGLCPVYPKWDIHQENPISYLPAVAVGIALIIFWLARKSWGRPFLLCLGYVLICLLPVLGFVNMGFMDQAYVADWWQQIPMIGVMALIGAGIVTLWRRLGKSHQGAMSGAVGLMIALLASLTWREAMGYESMEIYSRRVLARNPDSWSAHTNLATTLLAQSRFDEAIIHLKEAIQLNPHNEEAINNLGNALAGKGKTVDAIAQFQEAIRLRPSDASAHCNLGHALELNGRYDDAIVEDSEALRIKPNLAQAEYNLASVLKALGRLDDAIFHYREAIRIEPKYAEAHNNLGNIYQKQGMPDEAIAEYRTALRLRPDNATDWFNLATALQANGKSDDAISAYQQAIRLDPKMIAANWNLASLLLSLNREDEGLNYIRKVMALNPPDANTWDEAGTLMALHHRYAEAIDAYRKTIELQPDAVASQNRLAWLLATCPDNSVRNGAGAVDLATRTNNALGSKNPFALQTLAAAYAETGDFAQALTTSQQALALAGSNARLIALLQQEMLLYQKGMPVRQP